MTLPVAGPFLAGKCRDGREAWYSYLPATKEWFLYLGASRNSLEFAGKFPCKPKLMLSLRVFGIEHEPMIGE